MSVISRFGIQFLEEVETIVGPVSIMAMGIDGKYGYKYLIPNLVNTSIGDIWANTWPDLGGINLKIPTYPYPPGMIVFLLHKGIWGKQEVRVGFHLMGLLGELPPRCTKFHKKILSKSLGMSA